jgi:hypothetical protein
LKQIEGDKAETGAHADHYAAERSAQFTAYFLRSHRGFIVGADGQSADDTFGLSLAIIHGQTSERIDELFENLRPYIAKAGDVIAPYAVPRGGHNRIHGISSRAAIDSLQPAHSEQVLINNIKTKIVVGDFVRAYPIAEDTVPYVAAISPSMLYVSESGIVGQSMPATKMSGEITLPITPLEDQKTAKMWFGLITPESYDSTIESDTPLPITQLHCSLSELKPELQKTVYKGLAYALRHIDRP